MKINFLIVLILIQVLAACGKSGTPAPYIHYGEDNPSGSAGVHIVRPGDTAWSISHRYDIPLRDLLDRNRLKPPYLMKEGDRLFLPPPQTYTVRPGDTLFSISRQFDVSTTELARINALSDPYRIYTDQKIKLPYTGRFAGKAAQKTQTRRETSPAPTYRRNQPTKAADAPRPAIPPEVPPRSSGKFRWPVEGRIVSTYGPKKNGLHNDGINIASSRGAPVRAAENGVVVYVGDAIKGYGNLVLVRHDDNWMTAYAHLDRILVSRGKTRRRGQTIGTVGSTGQVDSPQLHFEVRRGTKVYDPVRYLEKR